MKWAAAWRIGLAITLFWAPFVLWAWLGYAIAF